MTDAVTAIACIEARDACKGEPDLIERIRKAMRVCHDHWMERDESRQLQAALAGVLLETSDLTEKDRIVRSFKAANRAGAMLQAVAAGVPVDLEAMAAEPMDDDLIPIVKLWRETAK